MKTTTLKNYFLIFALCLLSVPFVTAQGALYEIPLAQQVEKSSQIIEGKVIAQEGFWNQEQNRIFTLNTIEVYKVFKGQPITTVEMITPGGVVGLNAEQVTPSLGLKVNDVGMFTLTNSEVVLSNGKSNLMKAYSGPQGFYQYQVINDRVVNPFNVINGIETNFYSQIINQTRTPFVEIKENDRLNAISTSAQSRGSVSITSISPTSVTAGTNTVITITGTGFGGTAQNVGFTNSNDGGATYTLALATQIISWSDTSITVEVPSAAGNGNVAIIDNPPSMVLAVSSQSLSVAYAHINASFDLGAPGEWADNTQHYDDDGDGGYTWEMFTDFEANTPAKDSFIRALNTWRCETDVYWFIEDDPSAIDVTASDGTNIVRFDNGAELDPGVLGVCTSYFSGCLSAATEIEWWVTELDITFDDGVTWEYGPATPSVSEFDFESVAVHELGHGHQLGHVIDSGAIMHYAIGIGEFNRTLGSDDIDGANAVHTRSTTEVISCASLDLMDDWDCTLSNSEFDLATTITIYPSPATDVLYIRNNSFTNLSALTIYDINGRVVKQQDLSNGNELHSVNVTQLSNGVYFAQLATDNGTLTKKIIIE